MIKAGITAFLVMFLLLIASPKTYAQTPAEKLWLTNSSEKRVSVCESPLQLYVLALYRDCEAVKLRQNLKVPIAKADEVEEFSVKHSFETAYYTPTPINSGSIGVKSGPTPAPVRIVESINIAEPVPTVIVAEKEVESQDNNSDKILELINAHRAKIGKAPFQKDEALCSLAKTRSTELRAELANGVLHSGLYNRGLSYWVTENAKSGGNEEETVRWWLNSSIHRSAIQSDYVYSCGGCTGNNCSQLFTSYNPKGNKLASIE